MVTDGYGGTPDCKILVRCKLVKEPPPCEWVMACNLEGKRVPLSSWYTGLVVDSRADPTSLRTENGCQLRSTSL